MNQLAPKASKAMPVNDNERSFQERTVHRAQLEADLVNLLSLLLNLRDSEGVSVPRDAIVFLTSAMKDVSSTCLDDEVSRVRIARTAQEIEIFSKALLYRLGHPSSRQVS